jgi:hypothetical protein
MNLENFEIGSQENQYEATHFILALLQVRDQAHINHWQTKMEAEHVHFGMFYDAFLPLVDAIVEGILGKYGVECFQFGEAQIGLTDYSGNHMDFCEMVDECYSIFCQVFDKEEDSELFNEMDNIKMLRNKLTYLLNQR